MTWNIEFTYRYIHVHIDWFVLFQTNVEIHVDKLEKNQLCEAKVFSFPQKINFNIIVENLT